MLSSGKYRALYKPRLSSVPPMSGYEIWLYGTTTKSLSGQETRQADICAQVTEYERSNLQLKATLAALEADLEDLDESVKYTNLSCRSPCSDATWIQDSRIHRCPNVRLGRHGGSGTKAICGARSEGN